MAFTILNIFILHIVNNFLWETLFIFLTLVVIVVIELKVIFKATLRECVFLSSTLFAHIANFNLVSVALFSFILKIEPLSLRAYPNHKKALFSVILLLTCVTIIMILKYFKIKLIGRVAKEPKFSEMVSFIAIFMILYISFDTLILFEDIISANLLTVVLIAFVPNLLLLYQLFYFITKFVDINFYRRKTDILKNQYEQILQKKEFIFNEVNCDPLTNLYTRNFILNLLHNLCQSYTKPFGVFFADINGLKKVNDTLGHNVGDEYIKNTASIIMKSFREEDYVARIGGDEFLVLCMDIDDSGAKIILNRLEENMALLKDKDLSYDPSISIGYIIVTKELAAMGSKYIVAQADIKMCNNKECFYRNGGLIS